MTLLFTEGFDNNRSIADLQLKHNTVTPTAGTGITWVAGHLSGSALQVTTTQFTLKTALYANVLEKVVGFSVYIDDPVSSMKLVRLLSDQTTEQCFLEVATSGATFTLTLKYGATTVAVSSVLQQRQWYHIQLHVEGSTGATGRYRLDIDGVTDIDLTGIRTNDTSSALRVIELQLEANSGGSIRIDHLYGLDDTGTALNAPFDAPRIIEGIRPYAEGDEEDWVPVQDVGANNFQAVDDDGIHDGDTTYVYSALPGEKDLFLMTDLTFVQGPVDAVTLELIARAHASPPTVIRALHKNGVAETAGADRSILSTSYVYARQQWLTNPQTAAAWDSAEIDADQFGYESRP